MVREREEGENLSLTRPKGAMPPTILLLLVRFTTGVTYFNLSHHTTGCYTQMGNHKKAQQLLDQCPALTEKRKLGATKYLPTEVFILRKCKPPLPNITGATSTLWNAFVIVEFYREKQRRRTGSEDNYVESIKISTAEGGFQIHCLFCSL